jgi:hypothetical protein
MPKILMPAIPSDAIRDGYEAIPPSSEKMLYVEPRKRK